MPPVRHERRQGLGRWSRISGYQVGQGEPTTAREDRSGCDSCQYDRRIMADDLTAGTMASSFRQVQIPMDSSNGKSNTQMVAIAVAKLRRMHQSAGYKTFFSVEAIEAFSKVEKSRFAGRPY